MTTRTDELTIARPLVRYLRAGLKRKLSAKVDVLYVQLDAHLTPKKWEKALGSSTEGCELLAEVGLTDRRRQADVELDLHRWGPLIISSLELKYRDKLNRIREAEVERFDPALISRNAPELGELVREIRRRTGITPKRGPEKSLLQEQAEHDDSEDGAAAMATSTTVSIKQRRDHPCQQPQFVRAAPARCTANHSTP